MKSRAWPFPAAIDSAMSRLAKLFVLFVALIGLGTWGGNAQAAIITSTATGGLWSATTTWVGGVVPLTTDSVVIATTTPNVVTLAANTGVVALTINAGSTLNLVTSRIRPTGATSISGTINIGTNTGSRFAGMVTINAGGVWTNTTIAVNFRGGLTNNGGTFTAGTGIQTFNTTAQAIGGTSPITIPNLAVATIAVTNNGNLTVSTALTGTTGSLVNSATGILNIGGTSAITTLNAVTAGNTVNYTGAAQTAIVTTYSNLTLSGSGIKTFATTPTVNGVLSLEGAATVVATTGVVTYGVAATLQYNKPAAYTATLEEWPATFAATGGIIIANTGAITMGAAKVFNAGIPLTINAGATLTPGASLLTLGGDFNNLGTFTSGIGGVTIANTAATQSIDGFTTTGAVSMTKTAGTATLQGNVNGGGLTINGAGGTLDLGAGLTHTFTGAWTRTNGTLNGGSSTLNVGGSCSGAGGTFTAGTGTVNWNAAGAQTVCQYAYNNLTLSNGGAKTMTGVTAIAGDLSITGAATMTGNAAFTAGGALNYSSTGATTLAAPIVIGSYNQTAGTFSAGANAITVSGNWNETGIFTPGTGTVTLSGASAQTISGTSPVGFNNLTVTNGANPNITLATNVTVAGALTGTVTLTSTCPTDYTLTYAGPTELHSCPSPPTVTTNAATVLTASGATLNGTVSSNGAITTVTFDYGLTAGYGSSATAAQSPLAAGASGTAVSAAVVGLACNTLYHFRVKGVNSAGTTNGGDLTFTTSACPTVVINTYYPGTASVLAGATSITLGPATGVTTPIAIGDLLLIMQMQDATIDSTNTATYGTVSAANAGLYEYAVAASAVPLGGGTLSLLPCGIINAYTNADYVAGSSGQRRFQVIRVPVYASYTINAITALAWNGSTGGVLAFDVTGALNLNTATVDVSGMGFRGGASRTLLGPGATGANTDYRTLASVNNNASKGEGIAGTPQYVFTAPSTLTNTGVEGYPNGSHARGAPANGGGGGTDGSPTDNQENTGGGGGANAGVGGMGGIGWCGVFNALLPPNYNCSNSGGVSGYAVTGLGASRLTLGGGGGGATSNNGTGTPAAGLASSGAAGGGGIMIRADSFTGSATFNANGSAANNTVGNDGSGGGGAGGTVMLLANSGMAGATINVNGGMGGTNLIPPLSSGPHGPGGGGGGGYAITSGATASCNTTGGANGVTYNVGVLFGAYGSTPGSAGSCVTGLTAASIPGVALGATTCSSVDHFAINIGGASASTCTPKSITITAQDALNATVTNYTGTVNITTSPAHGDWVKGTPLPGGTLTPGAADSGAASYQFVAGDNGVATLELTNHHADGSQTITVVDSIFPATSRTSAAISFSDNTFVITNDTVQVAGRPQAMGVAMWRKDITTGVCAISPYYTGAKNLKAWLTLDGSDPGGAAPSIGILSLPSALPGANNLTTLTFSAGSTNFNLNTSDVGKYVLNLRDDSGTFAGTPGAPIQINGSSSTITTRPFALVVSAVKQGVTNNPANPGPGGTVFAKAGTSFQATVGAYLWNGAADTEGGIGNGVPDAVATLAQITANGAAPSYKWPTTLSAGVPFTPATPSDTPPDTGTPGSFSNGAQTGSCPTGAPNCFTSGIATPDNLSYNEVGSFTLSGAATSFLDTAGVDLTAANGTALVFDNTPARNGVVGRFYPDHFDLTLGSITPADAIGGFSYMGESFAMSFKLTAKNASGSPTQNYATANGFAKLDPATASWPSAGLGTNSSFGLGAKQGTADLSSRLTVSGTPSGTWTAGLGEATITANLIFSRPASTTADATWGPYETLDIGVAPQDADGVQLLPGALDLDVNNDSINERVKMSSTTRLRFGRLRLVPGQGSELNDYFLPVEAQYWNGAAWITNRDDGHTTFTTGNASISWVGSGSAPTLSSVATVTSGFGRIRLGTPGGRGIATICLDLGATTGCSATTPGAIEFLGGNWLGGAYTIDPSAVVYFGRPRPDSLAPWGFIYQRENF